MDMRYGMLVHSARHKNLQQTRKNTLEKCVDYSALNFESKLTASKLNDTPGSHKNLITTSRKKMHTRWFLLTYCLSHRVVVMFQLSM